MHMKRESLIECGPLEARTAVDPASRQYWLWCGILAPILGAVVSAGIYDLFLGHVSDKDDAQLVR